VSLQNIRDELQQKEVDSWQKLIRVLSHEILNSATPILSLSSAIKEKLSHTQDGKTRSVGLGNEDLEDLNRSIESIESRSRSLVNFVDAYRGLTRIPRAQIVSADINRMLENIYLLLNQELSDAGIELELKVHKQPLTLRIDPQLVEQVLINLVKNAADALILAHLSPHVRRRIVISTEDGPRGKVLIHVADNGIGVPKGELDNIFMPFYTTKRSGTGIGLSISRQIMFLNRGMLSVESREGKGSRFTLEFNPLVKDSRDRVG
jgi:signal transduction histidine kinase